MKFPILNDQDVFGEFMNDKTQESHSLFDNQIEQDQDDDVETDEEVLCSGIQQCHQDLRDLKTFLRSKNGHFRSETNVVSVWRKRGFWFSQDGR